MKYLFLLGYPILYSLVQSIIIFIFTLCFNFFTNASSSFIGTLEYQRKLSNFFVQQKGLIALITFILCLPLFYHWFKKTDHKKIEKPSIYNFFFGFLLAFLYNYILSFFNISFEPVTSYVFSFLLATVFLGPILEELIFRGIIFEKLKTMATLKQAIIIQAFIFALFHFTLVQFIYTFFFGIILGITFEKKGIISSIVMHISSNFMSFCFPFIFKFTPWYIPCILFLLGGLLLFHKKSPLFYKNMV